MILAGQKWQNGQDWVNGTKVATLLVFLSYYHLPVFVKAYNYHAYVKPLDDLVIYQNMPGVKLTVPV
jgi:hypothetical protein